VAHEPGFTKGDGHDDHPGADSAAGYPAANSLFSFHADTLPRFGPKVLIDKIGFKIG
jgi:hypothetical protein